MDTLNPNYNNNEYGYKASETETRSKSAIPGSFLGFFRSIQQPTSNTSAIPTEQAPGRPINPTPYFESTPVYRGKYEKLCPLAFNTLPVDDASNTKLDRSKFGTYDRAQLFFLLRLERFLRLRHYWLEASPREDESWKTELATRSVFSAFRDCQKHGVGEDGLKLLKDWNCC